MSLSTRTRRRILEIGSTAVPYAYGVNCEAEIADSLLVEIGTVDTLFFLVDAQVLDVYHRLAPALASHCRVEMATIEPAEPRKTLATVEAVMNQAITQGVTRKSVVVALGGGWVGNLAGMVAGLLFRGIRLVHLPTTPVSAFDSVLSLKQAVNLNTGKNLCGTYLTPSLIACDLAWLTHVPERQMRTGLVEMAKNVLISPAAKEVAFLEALDTLDSEPAEAMELFLEIGICVKEPYLRTDGKEKREALVFEYGHTVGHAVELASQGRVSHGESVGWGMLVAAEVSRAVLGLSDADRETHVRLLTGLGIRPDHPISVDHGAVSALVAQDNKRGYISVDRPDEVAMVLLETVGRAAESSPGMPLIPVPRSVVESAIHATFR